MLYFLSFLIFVFLLTFMVTVFVPLENDNYQAIPCYAVLTVKDKEDCIEGILRSLAQGINSANCISYTVPKELVVLDLGSQDKTYEIIRRLSTEYPFIHPMQKTDYIEFIKNM